jgi:hypothetical protein
VDVSAAVRYAHLVGKYVRMERPADEVETLEMSAAAGYGDDVPLTVGCEGIVAAVWDENNRRVGGPSVEVMMDYGMGYPILLDEEDLWKFVITDSMETMQSLTAWQRIPS